MAAAVHQPRVDSVPPGLSLYPHALALTEFDFKDNPYPPLTPPKLNHRPTNTVVFSSSNSSRREAPNSGDVRGRKNSPQPTTTEASLGRNREERHTETEGRNEGFYNQHTSQLKHDSVVSYALPAGPARRVVERYSLDDGSQRVPSGASEDATGRPLVYDYNRSVHDLPQQQQISQPSASRDQSSSSRRLPSSGAGMGAGPSTNATFHLAGASQSFSPSLGITLSPKPGAYAQHPTYITPPSAPHPVNPVYLPAPPVPPEEVCLECAMRDQDMVDVDVSSPGVWERESDALYEDLLQREVDEEAAGLLSLDLSRPKAKGGRLTEQNLKVWLSVNPREPASRQQTLETYIRSQRKLLEAEAMAHARAMQEAKHLDNRMRDAYSQLRRSAYDLGSTAVVADDSGGVRIKPPMSPTHARSSSRDVTLLENGMIVEHVDVRKEERETRERKRKEEKRARKVSRGSGVDVTSVYSVQSIIPHMDNSLGLKPSSRYSQASSARPTSVLTAPLDRSSIPRAYSQASFSDVHSLGSVSPRRSRFFGFKNLSASWRSQDSLAQSGMSGSMVNMHVALQRESYANALTQAPVDLSSPVSRRSQLWPPIDPDAEPEAVSGEKHKKRRNGLAKIWRIVTGSSKTYPVVSGRVPPPYERNEDDLPLAPPPPLSYLVERGPSELGIARHGSTASLQSTTSPKNALSSPGTAPSTVLPSPISSRRSGMDRDVVIEGRIQNGYYDDHEQSEALADEGGKSMNFRKIHSVISEPDILQRFSQNDLNKPTKLTNPYPVSVMSREKSLPPLPGEVQGVSDAAHVGARPRTMFAYDTTQMPFLASETQELLAPFAPFRNSESRRQSFGGMASPPNAAVQSVQTVPNRRGAYNPHELGPEYNEFGSSRRSLGRLEHVQEHIPEQRPSTPSSKRKSRFGFSLLLGRKHDKPAYETGPHVFPSLSRSGSDQRDDTITNTHARSRDGARMSMTSRKAVEELVSQDTEFVAYRYPSSDQRLDILR